MTPTERAELLRLGARLEDIAAGLRDLAEEIVDHPAAAAGVDIATWYLRRAETLTHSNERDDQLAALAAG